MICLLLMGSPADPVSDALGSLTSPALKIEVTGGAPLDVREFRIKEALSSLFSVDLVCVSTDPDIDFEAVIGGPACFTIEHAVPGQTRVFRGIVERCSQRVCEAQGLLSTYALTLVPELWLLTQNRTYRVFQDKADPDVALAVIGAWGLSPSASLTESYKARRYRVQYAESDFAFAARMLEDAGVTYLFDTGEEGGGALVVHDAPEVREPRGAPLPFVAKPTPSLRYDFVTDVRFVRAIKPGRYTQEDLDYRRPPTFPVRASSASGLDVEAALEVYHYNPGSFLFAAPGGGDTPAADDRGAQRTDLAEGGRQTGKRLDAKRGPARRVSFVTSALDVRPGSIVSFTGHPRDDLGPSRSFLVVASTLSGTATGKWLHACEAQPVTSRFRPPLASPRPKAHGVESATVVGPSGDEIHTDEFGRVRVHFHWDREGASDATSSCWIPVSQPWGGTSFGALNIPRVGQEVLVDFLGADPDRPVVMGRVFTKTNPPPYELPRFKDLQGLRSESTPRLPSGAARSGMLGGATAGGGDGSGSAGPQSSPLGGGVPLSMDQIAGLVTGSRFFQAASPGGATHAWQGSELTMHDPQGSERVYLQAQKDLHKVVKNNQVSVVGHAKTETIGTDNIRHVGNREAFHVGSDRTGVVNGEMREVVQLATLRQSVTEGQQYEAGETYTSRSRDVRFVTEETWASDAQVHVFASADILKLVCGSAQIVMRPDGIVIQGPLTHLNPGQDFVARALQGHSMAVAATLAPGDKQRRDFRRVFEEVSRDLGYRPTSEADPRHVRHRIQWNGRIRNMGYPLDPDTYNRGYTELLSEPIGERTPAPEPVAPPVSI